MRYRSFPRIPDLKISILGFGCMRLPILDRDYTRIDVSRAEKLLVEAIDAGVNYLDTAWVYHGGRSETFVGEALRRSGLRDRVLVATKVPVSQVKSESDWEMFLEEQLRRLQSDAIDFYLFHSLNRDLWERVKTLHGLEALARARAEGRIGHLGFSFHGSPDEFKEIVDGYDWEFCQVQYNLLDEHYQAGAEGVRYAAAKKIGVVAMEPLRGGGLAANVPADVQAVWNRYEEKRTTAEWALRWVWNDQDIVTALSGMNAEEQLRENLAAADRGEANAMSTAELGLVGEVRRYYESRTKVPCTTCGYCQPCPNGVAIPDVLSSYNSSAMFDARRSAAAVYRMFVMAGGHGADACLDCGECEPKCPQRIPIAAKLKEAHAHLTA